VAILGLAILRVCLIYVLGKQIRSQMSCGRVFSDNLGFQIMYVCQCRPHPAYVLFVFDIQGGLREDFGLWLIW
jgi:hypothetical protein